MSHKSWIKALQKIIQTNDRVAIVGVGHELRGDDAVGVQIVRSLQARIPRTEGILFCEAGPAPENFTAPLRRFAPDCVLFIDAVQMDRIPGTICLLDVDNTVKYPSSTHSLPLIVFAQHLENELNCTIFLLGIQPADLSFGVPLSTEVLASKMTITHILKALLCSDSSAQSSGL